MNHNHHRFFVLLLALGLGMLLAPLSALQAVEVHDLRCEYLVVGAKKTYPSCEEMIKDKNIEAIYIATDAPSHARLAIMALEHGKHVVSAVPAVFGFQAEDEAEKLFHAVRKSGMKYMMNEFIESILLDRKPIVDIGDALNMTLAGVIAHKSALKGGEWMKIPQYDL